MNKKILIGSIIAVTVLIGVSFTSVVGHRSVASDVKASPLFNIRSSRAIDEESEELSCAYVGKGNNINLLLPKRNDKLKLLRRAIEKILTIDDETFNKLISLVILRIQKNNKFNDVKNEDIILPLNKLRNHQEITFSNNTNMNGIYTLKFEFIPTICWFPGCIPLKILEGMIFIFIFTFFLLAVFIFDFTSDCVSPT